MQHCSGVKGDSVVFMLHMPRYHDTDFVTDTHFDKVLDRITTLHHSRGLIVPCVVTGPTDMSRPFFNHAYFENRANDNDDIDPEISGKQHTHTTKILQECFICGDSVRGWPREVSSVRCRVHRRPCTGKALRKRREESLFMSKFQV